MLAGHYAPALLIKAARPGVPMWLLFVAVQLADIAWAVFVLLGIEKVRIVPGFTASTPLDLYYMPYSHSLAAVLLWSLAAILVYRWIPRTRPWVLAYLLGFAVLSHWPLDAIVHVPDMPLYGDQHKVGLGLWNHVWLSLALELGLLALGAWYMVRKHPDRKAAAMRSALILCLPLAALQVYSLAGPAPATPAAMAATTLTIYLVFALLAWRFDWWPIAGKSSA